MKKQRNTDFGVTVTLIGSYEKTIITLLPDNVLQTILSNAAKTVIKQVIDAMSNLANDTHCKKTVIEWYTPEKIVHQKNL